MNRFFSNKKLGESDVTKKDTFVNAFLLPLSRIKVFLPPSLKEKFKYKVYRKPIHACLAL